MPVNAGTFLFSSMSKKDSVNLSYPIGKFDKTQLITEKKLEEWIVDLENFPSKLRTLVAPLTKAQLALTYKPGGWSVKEIVHHLADSHHHSYIRFKWALTEDTPVIKPYHQEQWAVLPGMDCLDIAWSLKHLEVVHFKLVFLLKSMQEALFDKTFIHPDGMEVFTLRQNVGQYAWHGLHHYTHIKNALSKTQ